MCAMLENKIIHSVFRQGLATLLSLESDFEVVGQAENGQEAISLTEQLMPDVVLMDVQMPLCNGDRSSQKGCLATGRKLLIDH